MELSHMVDKIKQANNDLDKQCMVRIENKLNEMISNILCCEEIFYDDIIKNNSKIKVEIQNNHNNIKQEFCGNSVSILNGHKQLIKDIGQKYIKVITLLFEDKTKQSNTFYNSLQQIENDNNDNDIKIKEEIIVKEENNNSDNEHIPTGLENVPHMSRTVFF